MGRNIMSLSYLLTVTDSLTTMLEICTRSEIWSVYCSCFRLSVTFSTLWIARIRRCAMCHQNLLLSLQVINLKRTSNLFHFGVIFICCICFIYYICYICFVIILYYRLLFKLQQHATWQSRQPPQNPLCSTIIRFDEHVQRHCQDDPISVFITWASLFQ